MVWQGAYLLASEETVSREFGAYDRIRDNFPKYVVSLDELDMSRITKRRRILNVLPVRVGIMDSVPDVGIEIRTAA